MRGASQCCDHVVIISRTQTRNQSVILTAAGTEIAITVGILPARAAPGTGVSKEGTLSWGCSWEEANVGLRAGDSLT